MFRSALLVGVMVWGLVGFVDRVRAAPILTYAFTGNTASPTFTAAGVTGNAVVNPGSNSGFSITSGQIQDLPDGANNVNQALSGGDYFEFSFAASNALSPLDLDTLTLDAAIGDSTGNQRFFVRSSQDGFANNLFLSANLSNTTLQNFSVDLSSLAQVTTAGITFRIYSFSNKDPSFRFDNFNINGTVTPVVDDEEEEEEEEEDDLPAPTVTPEPASILAWGLLTGVGMLGYRLRRKTPVAT